MVNTVLPERDLTRIQRWCTRRRRAEAIGIECDIAPPHATIYRRHRLGDHTECIAGAPRLAIARLRYSATTGLWTLYRPDRRRKYHRDITVEASRRVQDLLDHLTGESANGQIASSAIPAV